MIPSMKTLQHDFNRVVKYVKRWGVTLHFAEPPAEFRQWYDYHGGPVWGGIHWPTRSIFWEPREGRGVVYPYQPGPDWPNGLLHELSHVLARESPEHINEVESEMLAFEYYSSRFLHLKSWADWMKNYVLSPDGTEWPDTPTRYRGRCIKESLALAVKSGTMTESGKPTFVQPAWLKSAT
jgi:hypothetical protein